MLPPRESGCPSDRLVWHQFRLWGLRQDWQVPASRQGPLIGHPLWLPLDAARFTFHVSRPISAFYFPNFCFVSSCPSVVAILLNCRRQTAPKSPAPTPSPLNGRNPDPIFAHSMKPLQNLSV